MEEISLHILDVVENSIMAGASLVEIELVKDTAADELRLMIADNGRGIPAEHLCRVTDPFYTTRTTRRVGLGLALLSQTAERCEGRFEIGSVTGRGTVLRTAFRLSHLDRPPLGDMAGTVVSLVIGQPERDFIYRQLSDEREFVFDTREIKAALDGVPLSTPEVIVYLRENIGEGVAELGRI